MSISSRPNKDQRLKRLLEAGFLLADLPPPFVSNEFRSEEHTSELQSRENLVCRLLLEKKKERGQARIQTKEPKPEPSVLREPRAIQQRRGREGRPKARSAVTWHAARVRDGG